MAQEKMPDGTDAPLAFIPVVANKDCTEKDGGALWTRPPAEPTLRYPHIWYGNMDEDDWPEDYCPPWYHSTAQIDSLRVNTNIQGPLGTGVFAVTSTQVNFSGNVIAAGQVCGNTFCSASKLFDIPHPTKEKKRLVHACLEGPENGVYVRGRLTGNNVIELPDYWRGLVDPASITVSLTQIGSSQDLIVDKIEWGSRIVIRSGSASNIDCYYTVNATRKDVAPLEVEQDVVEGKSYPAG